MPDELKYKTDGTYLSLQTLWGNLIGRYNALGKPISADLQDCFAQTKLMVLNPQAHYNLSLPIYKVELEKAFELITALKAGYPVPKYTKLLTRGMKLQFKHPTENYTFDFELLSDFYIDGLEGATTTVFPRCRVNKWQFNTTDFWDFADTAPKIPAKPIEQRLEQIKARHLANVAVPLNIDSVMFDGNITIENSVWSFKEIIDKAGITI